MIRNWEASCLSPPPPHWLERNHILEVVQRLNRVLDRELLLIYTLPVSSIQRSNYQIFIANDFRVEGSEDSRKHILSLVLVGNEQITIGTVATGLIQQQWLLWVYMDEQRELTLLCLIFALRACAKPRVLIGIEKEAVARGLLAEPWHVLLILLPHCYLAIL